MKRKNPNTRYCVVCRTHSNGVGITSDDGVHICLNCAEMIHDVMTQWHEVHLDYCECAQCRGRVMLDEAEYEW